uniref:type II toxin-antitoxin system RelE/ParE family toxin n=1 Tax=Gemmiger formicilis TaxID=745368 RepID=UPI004028E426
MEKQYKVKVTVRAEQSLREISHYIAVDLTEPQAAVKLLRTLQKAINSLDMFPHRVHLTPEEPWHSLGIHRLVSKNYYIYFWIDESNLCVHITDVIYAGQNQPVQLENMNLED